MSLLLKDRVWSMEAATAKRGVYPLHGFKLGLYRLPIKLEDPVELKSVHDGLKKAFEMDMYADRIYATYRWKEQNMDDPDAKGYQDYGQGGASASEMASYEGSDGSYAGASTQDYGGGEKDGGIIGYRNGGLATMFTRRR